MEPVGIGAFGSVWKAYDDALDRVVAIKIPRRGQLSPFESEQFLREARSVARLKHPNIVAVHEVGRTEYQVYIVSDFIDGMPLSEWLTENTLTPKEAAHLTRKIAGALHHAHSEGVIHRDLKPSNIMMDQASEPHLVDFGLAKRDAGEITMTADGKILGTPAYMSPEQAQGEAHRSDSRSDVYSLGVVLFEMLTGERPFRGDNRILLQKVLHEEPLGPRRINGSVPRDLDTICLKCLEKKPSRRYATAMDLATDLDCYRDGRPIAASPVSPLSRGVRWCQRNPTVAVLIAIVFILLLVLSAISFRMQPSEHVPLVLAGHRGVAKAAEFSPDGRYIVSCGGEKLKFGEAMLFDTALGEKLSDLEAEGGKRYFTDIAFGPRATRIAAASSPDRSIIVWDATTRNVSLRLPLDQNGHDVAFSPDGVFLAVAECGYHADRSKRFFGPCDVSVWNLKSGEQEFLLEGNLRDVHSVSFSSDGKKLASGGKDGTIQIWNAITGIHLNTLQTGASVLDVAFLPYSNLIVSTGETADVQFWDVDSGANDGTLPFRFDTTEGTALACSCDGAIIACADNTGVVRLWDAKDRELLREFKAHDAVVQGLAFSLDGKQLVSASHDSSLKVWSTDFQ